MARFLKMRGRICLPIRMCVVVSCGQLDIPTSQSQQKGHRANSLCARNNSPLVSTAVLRPSTNRNIEDGYPHKPLYDEDILSSTP